MKYSVCIDAVFMNKGSFKESMKKVKEAGYEAIEFWTWWDKDVDEIAKVRKELGLEIATFCTKFVNPGDKEKQNDYLNGLKEINDQFGHDRGDEVCGPVPITCGPASLRIPATASAVMNSSF